MLVDPEQIFSSIDPLFLFDGFWTNLAEHFFFNFFPPSHSCNLHPRGPRVLYAPEMLFAYETVECFKCYFIPSHAWNAAVRPVGPSDCCVVDFSRCECAGECM